MRVWVPVSIQDFLVFDQTGSLEAAAGYSVTQGFAQVQSDQDEEVLEAQILEIAGSGKPLVLVVEAMATELAGDSGEVTLTQVSTPKIKEPHNNCLGLMQGLTWHRESEDSSVDFLVHLRQGRCCFWKTPEPVKSLYYLKT